MHTRPGVASLIIIGSPCVRPHILSFGALIDEPIGDFGAAMSQVEHHFGSRMIVEDLDLHLSSDDDLSAPVTNTAAENPSHVAFIHIADRPVDPDS
jgi:hypothetical protein